MSGIQTKNLGFILRSLGREAGPAAFLREMTQNSLEAIGRAGVAGDVKWDLYWPYAEQNSPLYKLVCVDTGIGMTGADLVDLIGQVSASGQEQTATGNFGVGAKIAAFCRNESGLTYMSWTAGNSVGAKMTIWWDSDLNDYAIKLDGDGNQWSPISPEQSSAIKSLYGIEEHGTIVLFGGNDVNENTSLPPVGFIYQDQQWISKYLTSRYYEFPSDTSVLVRDTWNQGRNNSTLVPVETTKSRLDRQSETSGSVDLSDATVYYWISPTNINFGEIGLLYQSEIYELLTGSNAFSMLQKAGIKFGGHRIELMVCPTSGVFSTLTRTALTDTVGDVMPWNRWMAELKSKLPEAIIALIHNLTPQAFDDYRQSYQTRLEDLLTFFKRDKSGGKARRRNRHAPIDKPPLNYPKEIRWVTITNGSRAEGDMENRAAKYVLEGELLLINEDFSIHQKMSADIKAQFPGYEEDAVLLLKEWQEQQYVEAILSARKIGNRGSWSQDALTAVGGVVWNVWQHVTQELTAMTTA